MRGPCLRGIDFTNANLTEADMRDGLLMKSVERGEIMPIMAESESATIDRAILKGADMSGAKLSNAFVVQTDLSDANLRNARFVRADLSFANFTGAVLDGAIFTMPTSPAPYFTAPYCRARSSTTPISPTPT